MWCWVPSCRWRASWTGPRCTDRSCRDSTVRIAFCFRTVIHPPPLRSVSGVQHAAGRHCGWCPRQRVAGVHCCLFCFVLFAPPQAVISSPYDVIVIIAQSIPRQSTFFITYVMLLGSHPPRHPPRHPTPLVPCSNPPPHRSVHRYVFHARHSASVLLTGCDAQIRFSIW